MKGSAFILLATAACAGWSTDALAQRGQPGSRPPAATRPNAAAPRIVAEAERALQTPPVQIPENFLQTFRTQTTEQYLSGAAFSFGDNRLIYSLARQPSDGWVSITGLPVTLSAQTDQALGLGGDPVTVTLGMGLSAQGPHLVECRTQGLDQSAWTLSKGPTVVGNGPGSLQNGVHMFVVDIPAGGVGRPAVTIDFSRSAGSTFPIRSFESCQITKINKQ
jgi:hypothetical protein